MPSLTPPDELADDVVTARLMTDADVADFVRGTDDPDVARFGYARSFDEVSAREYIADLNGTRRERGEAIQFSLRDRASGAFLGALLFAQIDWDRGACSVGFWLLPEARGRGVVRRALALGLDWIMGLGIERVSAQTDVDNAATRRTLDALGFVQEGVLRGFQPGPDGRRDYVCYGLLASDRTSESASATRAT